MKLTDISLEDKRDLSNYLMRNYFNLIRRCFFYFAYYFLNSNFNCFWLDSDCDLWSSLWKTHSLFEVCARPRHLSALYFIHYYVIPTLFFRIIFFNFVKNISYYNLVNNFLYDYLPVPKQ